MVRSVFSLLLLILLSVGNADARELSYWRYWTSRDGLRESWVESLVVDLQGRVWVGHGEVNQVSILDGYEIRQLPVPATHPELRVGPNGFVYDESTVHAYDEEKKTWRPFEVPEWAHRFLEETGAEDPIVGYIPRLPRVLLLYKRFLFFMDAATQRAVILKTVTDTQLGEFVGISSASDGGAWIGGTRGIAKLGPFSTRNLDSVSWEEHLFPSEFQIEGFFSPAEGKNGIVYGLSGLPREYDLETLRADLGKAFQSLLTLYLKQSIVKFDGESFELNEIAPVLAYRQVVPGRYGRRWLISAGINVFSEYGHKYVDSDGNEHTIGPLEIGTPSATAASAKGDIWFGGDFGVARFSPPLWDRVSSIADDVAVHEVLQDDKGRLWFDASDRLILNDHGRWEEYKYPARSTTQAFHSQTISLLPDGRIFVNFQNVNHIVFDPDRNEFTHIQRPEGHPISFAMAPARNGSIWVVSPAFGDFVEQIHQYDGKEFKRIWRGRAEVGLGGIRCIFQDREDSLWIGGIRGLAVFDGQSVQRVATEVFKDGALSITQLKNGALWVGTRNCIYESTDGKSWNLKRAGFDQIPKIVESDDGSVWVSSWSGVHRYLDESWIAYTQEDGLSTNVALSVYQDDQQRIWVGTNRGLRLYQPDSDPDPPRAYLPEGKNLKETPPGGEVQIVYEGVDKWNYTPRERLYYSYRLDGGNWTPFRNETVAVLTGLPSSPHVFEVRAMDLAGNISRSPASWEFRVLRYWYHEPHFLLILVLGAVTILALLAVSISRHIRLRSAYGDLQVANERLRELDELKSSFVSQASHDLRTPLTGIKSSLDNLVRGVGGGLNERQTRVVERALRSVNRLTHLINDVLDINRIESGRMVVEKHNVHFEEIVKSILNENQPAAKQKNITLESQGLSESCPMKADPGKIERVVGELISNAIKYTPENGTVSVRLSRKGRDTVTVKVKDTGIGLSAEECDRIFERFYRARASQNMAKGSGLGLSIAKELVEMHGGSLTVESGEGQGTTFIMSLPITGEEK